MIDGTFSDIWQAVARAEPDRLAMATPSGHRFTYGRFAREARGLAAHFSACGLRPGDRVGIVLYNRPEFLTTLFACLALGLTPVPMNFRYRSIELAALLMDSKPRALVYAASLRNLVAEATGIARGDIHLVEVTDVWTPRAHATPWAEAIAAGGALPDRAPADGEMWIYTGGTTGQPKAVRWRVVDMFRSKLFSIYDMNGLAQPASLDEAVATALQYDHAQLVNLPLAPFMHGTAMSLAINALAVGGAVLVTSSLRFDADAAVRLALQDRATQIVVAGDAVAMPFADAAERMGVTLPLVRAIVSSGMRFSTATKRRLHRLGDLTIQDIIASSEGGGFAVTVTTGVDDLPGRARLYPDAVVLDENGRPVDDRVGARGMLARSGTIPIGYFRDEEKTAAAFPVIEGVRYVMPGDWVVVEDDRHVEFLGRGSAVINSGGEKVYPDEVEEALLAHPAVRDAVVVGVPDERFGEIVAAAVVLGETDSATGDDLAAWVGGRLAAYKKPRAVVFRTGIARGVTGKIDLARLRAELMDELNERAATSP
ncbi:acyl-CoA synthetase [Microbacterium kribbense]|uniref:Acyl-CoA synthetase n=1 Tax=Microbacterium kribbense TaxID=433645 RepID=A0ABP7GL17_9MICO